MVTTEVMEAIKARDPDGRETKPTDQDHVDFRRWVIRTYGQAAWRAYSW